MNRELLNNLEQYLRSKTEPTQTEKDLLAQLEQAKTSFDIAFIDRATIARNGFRADGLSDDDMQELAGKIGDLYCGSSNFDNDLEQACRDMELEALPQDE